jgi:AcrR family transcriptional regulator
LAEAANARTRDAVVAAVRALLAEGVTPTVEEAAEAAGVSRTTTYRYFPNQRALLLAAHPEIEQATLLGPDAPSEVRARLDHRPPRPRPRPAAGAASAGRRPARATAAGTCAAAAHSARRGRPGA